MTTTPLPPTLIARAQDGDVAALEQVTARALTIARRAAMAITRDPEEAGDVAQDVGIEVLRGLGALKDPAAFDGWVRTITQRRCARRSRWFARRGATPTDPELLTLIPDVRRSPEDRAISRDDARTLATAMKSLPSRSRLALTLRYAHDLSEAQVGAALGCSEGAAAVTLSRARTAMRNHAALAVERQRRLTPGVAAALVALMAAAVVALLPAGREAVAGILSRIDRFLSGGEAPGEPLTPAQRRGTVWMMDAVSDSPRVMASRDGQRLLAYRQAGTGAACVAMANTAAMCGQHDDWRVIIAGRPFFPVLTTMRRDGRGRLLWGLADDGVARVEVRYRSGRVVGAPVTNGGFVVAVEGFATPVSVMARGDDGALRGRVPAAGFDWGRPAPAP